MVTVLWILWQNHKIKSEAALVIVPWTLTFQAPLSHTLSLTSTTSSHLSKCPPQCTIPESSRVLLHSVIIWRRCPASTDLSAHVSSHFLCPATSHILSHQQHSSPIHPTSLRTQFRDNKNSEVTFSSYAISFSSSPSLKLFSNPN